MNTNELVVVKIGGNVVDNETVLQQFLTDFSKIKQPKLLIHGGGKIASRISKALGIEPQMVEGRRITDAETLKIVTMVYAGWINKSIVAQLQALSVKALGLCGADANLIRSVKRPIKNGVDYGYVADVVEVNDHFLRDLIQASRVPVIAPITHDKNGQLLNTNADTVASVLAVAMTAFMPVKLVYCFELLGVMRDINDANSCIEAIDASMYKELKSQGVIADGMIPKLDNCFDAIQKGVSEVCICHSGEIAKIASGEKTGTRLYSK